MAKKAAKKSAKKPPGKRPSAQKAAQASASAARPSVAEELQRPAAEVLYAEELARLREHDANEPRPRGWQLTPRSVLAFVLGDDSLGTSPKFVGRRSLLERCIVALATSRGLMMIGEPGTAKSFLSELLAAAISGDSTLTVQGSAGTTEDSIKYGWNYALLVSEGPGERALVPAPLHEGMTHGKIVRFEEITRCALEIQDTMLSVLSDRVLTIPELPEGQRNVFARAGFNVIATANTRDRGVNEMSAALKRRFNFETIPPIDDIHREMSLVQRETDRLLARAEIPLSLSPDLTEVLVTTFRELRMARTKTGKEIEPLTTVMSTAEAVATGYAAGLHAFYYDRDEVRPRHVLQHLVGSVMKDDPEDLARLKKYLRSVVAKRKGLWQELHQARVEAGAE